jgi:putative DNA primase/helicase
MSNLDNSSPSRNGKIPQDTLIKAAQSLWGEKYRVTKGGTVLRFGARGSKSLRLDTDQFYDFEAQRGGGAKDLLILAGLWREHPDWVARVHDYRDADGALVFQTIKKTDGLWTARRPGTNGARWDWHVPRAIWVLYRLPELITAKRTRAVFLPEGEKDADAVAKLGLIATSNPFGGGNWDQSYNRHLFGRHVIVLPDNDAQGEKHAEVVTRALTGIAARVRVLRLPGLAEKGDVSDWLKAGGDRAQLLALARDAP